MFTYKTLDMLQKLQDNPMLKACDRVGNMVEYCDGAFIYSSSKTAIKLSIKTMSKLWQILETLKSDN